MMLGFYIVFGIGLLISGWAAMKVRSTFERYSQLTTRAGLTGAQVAQRILDDNGIHDVRIERVPGQLSDHYDPTNKTLRLSEPVYDARSIAAFGVAAHEVGHALQHAKGYSWLQFRSAWVPVASTGGSISMIILMAAFFLKMSGGFGQLSILAAWIGILLFATTTIFTLITLPVEFDASKRALVTLEAGGYATTDELHGARKVLNAAAMTYVAAFLTSLMQLAYWAMMLLGGGSDE